MRKFKPKFDPCQILNRNILIAKTDSMNSKRGALSNRSYINPTLQQMFQFFSKVLFF